MKRKKVILIILFIALILFLFCFIIFKDNTAKKLKIGNNSTSQEIVNYILNIQAYETTVEVEIITNKNENKYKIKQIYNGEEKNMQEVLEPSNIAGVKIIREGNKLKLENTNLNIISIFENYQYVSDNSLDLCTFIKEYKNNQQSNYEEKIDKIIMITHNNDKVEKKLYINKKDGMPLKMEIKDNNKNTAVYILYNEVKVNS